MADSDELLLPEGCRLVHIGPQKTGSTAIQNALRDVRHTLLEHGVLYPGRGSRPREAGWAVLGRNVPRGRRVPTIERWHELVREVQQAGDLRVCISNEDFGKARLDEAHRIIAGLGGERAHVVAAARRLDRLLPSQWQERVKSRATIPYEEWLKVVLSDSPDQPIWTNVWTAHDVEALVNRWARVVGRDRITLILTDDANRDFLPRTFERLLGLPRDLLAADAVRSNRSLSMNEIELVRYVNREFVDNEWPDHVFRGLMQLGLISKLKAAPRSAEDQPIPQLPPWAAERVDELSAQRAEAVKRLGVRVVGDPESLRTPPPADLTVDGGPVMVSLDLAARAIHGVIDGALQHEARFQNQHLPRIHR